MCCIHVGVSREQAAAVRTCVCRLATMFTVSNELMSLMEGLSETVSPQCLSWAAVGVG